jgi:hypothetical protein
MASRYSDLIASIFADKHDGSAAPVEFARTDIEGAAAALQMNLPRNLGDVIYSFRFRAALPQSIVTTAPQGLEWVIKLAGRGLYRFELVSEARVVPNPNLIVTKVPDATPEIIGQHALGDEQAVLAKVRYNRLIDIFLGVTAYSLQNHLRTTVENMGQIEIDEVYLAIDRHGAQYIVPVQAKGGNDEIGLVQVEQDLAWAEAKFPRLTPRAIATQFMADDVIAMFELTLQDSEVRVVEERHYRLVPGDSITEQDLALYRQNAG